MKKSGRKLGKVLINERWFWSISSLLEGNIEIYNNFCRAALPVLVGIVILQILGSFSLGNSVEKGVVV